MVFFLSFWVPKTRTPQSNLRKKNFPFPLGVLQEFPTNLPLGKSTNRKSLLSKKPKPNNGTGRETEKKRRKKEKILYSMAHMEKFCQQRKKKGKIQNYEYFEMGFRWFWKKNPITFKTLFGREEKIKKYDTKVRPEWGCCFFLFSASFKTILFHPKHLTLFPFEEKSEKPYGFPRKKIIGGLKKKRENAEKKSKPAPGKVGPKKFWQN